MAKIRELTIPMATDNPGWGYTRIVGSLANVGHRVARTTIANICKRHGIKPAPERPTSWRTFLKAHAGSIVAADFFTAEVWTARGLVTHYVLFAIDLATRAVTIAGVTTKPDAKFMAQIARNLTDHVDGFLRGKKFFVVDRDTKFDAQFRRMLGERGVEVVQTAARAQHERLRRTLRAHDQRRVFVAHDLLRRGNAATRSH